MKALREVMTAFAIVAAIAASVAFIYLGNKIGDKMWGPRSAVSAPAPAIFASDTAPDTALVAGAWAYVRLCSGLSPMMGRGVERVHWRVVPAGSLWVGHVQALGLYIDPDTIVLDASATRSRVVVAHELLHYLLGGPPTAYGGPHPAMPFAWPCELMLFQHADDAS